CVEDVSDVLQQALEEVPDRADRLVQPPAGLLLALVLLLLGLVLGALPLGDDLLVVIRLPVFELLVVVVPMVDDRLVTGVELLAGLVVGVVDRGVLRVAPLGPLSFRVVRGLAALLRLLIRAALDLRVNLLLVLALALLLALLLFLLRRPHLGLRGGRAVV